jgi:hypothetical protein
VPLPAAAAAPPLGMEEYRLLSKHRSHVAWRPKLPGQIGFGWPNAHRPPAQEDDRPSGTDMKRVAEQPSSEQPSSE